MSALARRAGWALFLAVTAGFGAYHLGYLDLAAKAVGLPESFGKSAPSSKDKAKKTKSIQISVHPADPGRPQDPVADTGAAPAAGGIVIPFSARGKKPGTALASASPAAAPGANGATSNEFSNSFTGMSGDRPQFMAPRSVTPIGTRPPGTVVSIHSR